VQPTQEVYLKLSAIHFKPYSSYIWNAWLLYEHQRSAEVFRALQDDGRFRLRKKNIDVFGGNDLRVSDIVSRDPECGGLSAYQDKTSKSIVREFV
jgi:hypothetical protein